MPYRELTMIDVKEVLRRWSAGHGDRKIGREAGVDRKTVARYTDAAKQLGLEPGRELTDEEVHQIAQCVQSRPLASPSDEWNAVAQHRERIERWLAGDDETRPRSTVEDPHAPRARSRAASELRHAPSLRDAGARVA